MIIQQAPIDGRNNLGNFLNQKGLLREGVEVGTHRGKFARQILSQWKGQCLYCIDHWQTGWSSTDPTAFGDRSLDRAEAVKLLTPFKDRARILCMTSIEASDLFSDKSLDFVYIDGNHHTTGFRSDVETWWPKLKPGGILAGHDVVCPYQENSGWGYEIQPVLFRFCDYHNKILYLITEPLGRLRAHWSFYIER